MVAAPGRGLTVATSDQRFAITLRARMQLRTTLTTHDDRATELDAGVRTLRFVVSGNVLVPELKYFIQLAFAAGDYERDTASPIFDAFVEYTKLRDLNVRVGQFFVPFDRARTTREFALQFVDRQQVVRELTLDRDFGLMLSSQDLFGLGSRLGYHLFAGSGDGKNRVLDSKNPNGPQKPGVLLVGRLVTRPFGAFDDDQEGDLARSTSPHLALGVAGAYNISSDRDKGTYGATFVTGTFNYVNAAADLVFKWHGFSLFGEVLYRNANKASNTGVPSGATAPITERSRSGYGYFVQAGQMLTGLLEVVTRWEELFAKEGTDPALRDLAKWNGRQIGGGLNLYLNGHFFKLQTDYFYIFGVRDGRESHVARLQLDASF